MRKSRRKGFESSLHLTWGLVSAFIGCVCQYELTQNLQIASFAQPNPEGFNVGIAQ